MKRAAILRRSPLTRTGRLQRVAMKRGVSVPQQKQQALRKTAYQVVDQRSGLRCEWPTDTHGGRCVNAATDHHHRRAREMGGSTNPAIEAASNILGACRSHHDATHAKPAMSRVLGLIVAQGQSPAATPVTLAYGSVLLTNDGNYLPAEETP